MQLAVSIVVPTYREAENIPVLVPRVADAMTQWAGGYELIIVDDFSGDGTVERVAELSRNFPVRVISRTSERGLSSAVLRGMAEARGDVLICMDADLSHPPEALPELIHTLDDPAVEFVIGSRYVRGGATEESWGVLRWLNSKVATLLARPFTSATDPMAGFFALPRRVFERAAELSPIGYKIGLELLVKCRCRTVREVPIFFSQRKYGESKLSLREQLRYLQHLRRLAGFRFPVLRRVIEWGGLGALVLVAVLIGRWVMH